MKINHKTDNKIVPSKYVKSTEKAENYTSINSHNSLFIEYY